MEAEHKDLNERLEFVFDNFLKPNYTPQDGIYFDKLLKHLSAEEQKNILTAPFIFEWINKCVDLMVADFKQVQPQVVALCLNLTSLALSNEWSMLALKKRDVLDNLIQIFQVHAQNFTPSVKLGSIRFIKAVCEYSVGCMIVGAQGSWRHIHNFCLRDHTVYVVHEARQLMFTFIYKCLLKAHDEPLVAQIVEDICKPIHNTGHHTDTLIQVDDEKLTDLVSTIDLLTYIFEQTIESKEKLVLLKYCNAEVDIQLAVWKLTSYTQNYNLLSKILNLQTAINFTELLENHWSGSEQISADNFAIFGVNFYNTLRWYVTRGECINVLTCVRYNYILWRKLGERVPKHVTIENELLNFAQMLLVFQMIPLFRHNNPSEMEDDVFSKNFVMKIFEIQSEHAIRLCYTYRDICHLERSNAFLADLCYKAVNSLVSLVHVFDRAEAILVFQALMNSLKVIVETISEETDDPLSCISLVTENVNVCYGILVGMESLIQRYRITWKESIESICLVNFIVVLLERNLSMRLCVQSLKVIQLCLEHFMAPNMALLIDDISGSSLGCLGPCILRTVHNNSWEIRDSTLELLNSITQISKMKFPSFQNIVIEHDLVNIVFNMAKHDAEAYVRASAYKCLTSMVAVEKIWENHMDCNQIIEHLLHVMYNEQEGIVRQEAVNTMNKICEKRKIPTKYDDRLYSIFTYLIANDLHWEVSVNALIFWKLEIMRLYSDQGMIDGVFPQVTFSKEHKKIVQLNTREIKVRLTKILHGLASSGCLAILYKCLGDDVDFIVTSQAAKGLKCMQSVLKRYDFVPDHELLQANEMLTKCPQTNDQSTMATNTTTTPPIKEDVEKTSDEVIDEILKDQDLDYVVEICKQKLNMNGETNSPTISGIDPLFYKQFAFKNTKEFLELLTTQDLDKLIENRQNWITQGVSFEAFVDELYNRFNAKDGDANYTTDCY